MAVLDAEQSGNLVEIPKAIPVCEMWCIFKVLKSVWLTGFQPRMLLPKLRSSVHENSGFVSVFKSNKPLIYPWSNKCAFGICNLIFNRCSNGYKSKGRCSHLLCGTGWSRTSQCPKNGLADAASLLHLRGSLGKAAPSPHTHLSHSCTKLTYGHTYLYTALFKQWPVWGKRTCGEKGQSWGAAALYGMVPSAVCDFQLEVRTVVSA